MAETTSPAIPEVSATQANFQVNTETMANLLSTAEIPTTWKSSAVYPLSKAEIPTTWKSSTVYPLSKAEILTTWKSSTVYPLSKAEIPTTWKSSTLYPLSKGLDESTTAIHVGADVEDGAFNAVLVGVIVAVILVLFCLVAVLLRYIYRHKGTYHTNEAKGTELAEDADAALKRDPVLQESVDDGNKEYFI
ncbi:glycophorin-C-like isoform X2 [Anguilla anguilla]|uniref:glycophorin-C-like isoform X2 n=1 Tax=Anguilla anguilla TaxID=7936 RepID=UPI0015ABEC5C|nr:glycophorin-C-like isoform X2 [Anguilla anguilla]